ncbi:restriction endonuclease [Companilactobacillus jidongensis]|uniref:restriction endonuclease n=1 Tax=Companilactobacillus jidongensis TaxID=2486006 RepID=UPI000F79F642|nr:restriction endonuclease [Companilactobacillus jidongensis]
MANYKRQPLRRYILDSLQILGGSASRKAIKNGIVDDNTISYDDAFGEVISSNGNKYHPFDFDFNFGLKELVVTGYIEEYKRGQDIVLTEKGRSNDHSNFPNKKESQQIRDYWDEKDLLRAKRNKSKLEKEKNDNDKKIKKIQLNTDDSSDDPSDTWKIEILDQIKQFSPKKFESFSRLLISKMGVIFDNKKGVMMSGDHGIDGYGYFKSDEFRTSRVAIQCKKYTDGSVSEPEIDKFKGVMLSMNVDYGIFITTSFFTLQARLKAVQGGKTVTLIDGQGISELIEKYQLHVTPVRTYSIDDYYFEEN